MPAAAREFVFFSADLSSTMTEGLLLPSFLPQLTIWLTNQPIEPRIQYYYRSTKEEEIAKCSKAKIKLSCCCWCCCCCCCCCCDKCSYFHSSSSAAAAAAATVGLQSTDRYDAAAILRSSLSFKGSRWQHFPLLSMMMIMTINCSWPRHIGDLIK